MTEAAPRWIARFENYSRALARLREAIEALQVRTLSPLEQEGIVQRFEYTWELAWKVLKDYLEAQGTVLATVTPASAIRAALAARLIADGEVWMKALDARNRMSHSYSLKAFEETVLAIQERYLAVFEALHARLHREADASAPRG